LGQPQAGWRVIELTGVGFRQQTDCSFEDRRNDMSKLLSTLIAAAFAVTTFGAVAQTPPAKGDAPKAAPATPAQPSDKAKTQKKAKADKSKADKPKTEKKAKSDKPKSGKSTTGDGKKAKGDGKKSEKAAAPKQEEAKK